MSALPTTDAQVLLLHNPRCSKSRAVETILREQRIEFTVRPYLDEPLSRAELEDLAARLDRPPREWIRRGQKEYAALGLDAGSSDEAYLDAMAAHPILMERPIVVRGDRAILGRPPQGVLDLFDD